MSWRRFFWALGLSGLALGSNFLVYLRRIPTAASLPEQVRGIIVLTGDKGRLETGFSLLSPKRRLFISGVHPRVRSSDLPWKEAPEGCRHRQDLLTLGYSASNTWENVLEGALWMQQGKLSSVGLVTSDYHVPRSLAIFSRILPSVRVYPVPVVHRRDKTWYVHAFRESLGTLWVTLCAFFEKL
ncbi:MAG: YdcF family protein [Holosporales bacterium]|jgi:uncharacterized SAM-binding protein YcdF (DUF218 family)|nr:YdcF family protein [Holosporales bacterium]